MQPSRPGLALEGLPVIGLAAFATVVAAVLGWSVPALAGLLFTAFSLWFFRDPVRIAHVTEHDAPVVVSPADGRVLAVDRQPDPVSGVARTRICIFMNVFNVHVNRAPVPGRVVYRKHHPGKFFNASFDKASVYNERCVLTLQGADGRRTTLVQIAGLVARRIVCRVEPGDVLALGERFGCIMFGSRVDVYLDDAFEPVVKAGDGTLAGMTVLAVQSPGHGDTTG
ncbi:phosphatidylserine decarboxylase family protein [Megalodesulfovibrio gigas]|uniref:Phosphatidylserine decarboxylase proenzyme n=1 Tax=Megalodesulfovibrio gigas (strain ATCC 19364 / DSM 1382 / NCIMB 9332 / VKM B-1759) TaxID=1121448 RepID=T2GF23_MEGG1|nr:putative phosphatidylserine decarboxylase [Megalodesulfovibrio gigas DSM 1382 = ATCC 19364]